MLARPGRRRRRAAGGLAAGLVRLFAPAKRCRTGTSGEVLVAGSDSDATLEVLDSDPSQPADGPAAPGVGPAPQQLEEAPAPPEEEPGPGLPAEVGDGAPAGGGGSELAEAVLVLEVKADDTAPAQDGGSEAAGAAPVLEVKVDEGAPAEGGGSKAAGAAPVLEVKAGLFEEFEFRRPPGCPAAGAGRLVPTPARARKAEARRRSGAGGEEEEDLSRASPEERLRVLQKWRDMAGPAASPAALRLQLLVAAILHPKTSEAIVRSCMAKLRTWAEGRQGLSAGFLATADPAVLEELWEGLHWHRVKAGRVIAAAATLDARWGGAVPTLREELITLPGVGPKLAGILAFVFEGLAPACEEAQEAKPAEAAM